MTDVTLADGRLATLLEVHGVEYVVIEKPTTQIPEYHHSYSAIVGNQEMTWEAHDEWPESPGGAWAYRAVRTDHGYITRPWIPMAGGHGRTLDETMAELHAR